MPLLVTLGCALLVGLGFLWSGRRKHSDKPWPSGGYARCDDDMAERALIGMIPFLVGGYLPRFSNAPLESVSGFTTTGRLLTFTFCGASPPKGSFFGALSCSGREVSGSSSFAGAESCARQRHRTFYQAEVMQIMTALSRIKEACHTTGSCLYAPNAGTHSTFTAHADTAL